MRVESVWMVPVWGMPARAVEQAGAVNFAVTLEAAASVISVTGAVLPHRVMTRLVKVVVPTCHRQDSESHTAFVRPPTNQ